MFFRGESQFFRGENPSSPAGKPIDITATTVGAFRLERLFPRGETVFISERKSSLARERYSLFRGKMLGFLWIISGFPKRNVGFSLGQLFLFPRENAHLPEGEDSLGMVFLDDRNIKDEFVIRIISVTRVI